MVLSFFPSIQDQSSAVTTFLRSRPGRARQAGQNKPISSTFHEVNSEIYDFEKWMSRVLSSFHDCETSRGRTVFSGSLPVQLVEEVRISSFGQFGY